MKTNTDALEKRLELKAPVSRVWRALTNHVEFGHWFRVNLTTPFAIGQTSRGHILHPGYEHLVMEIVVQAIQPERFFSYTWHPYAIDPKVDYSKEPPTLVEFTLTPCAVGTLLVIRESGFDHIPASRRSEAFRMNDSGWSEQLKNIAAYVSQA